MGLFSSKKKTQVGTVVSRVIEDGAVPNAIRTGVLRSVFDRVGASLTDYVLEELTGSLGLRVERMYRYAKNHYTFGLPSGQTTSATKGANEIKAILEANTGKDVTLGYSHFGPPNSLHIGWSRLITNHGYRPATNRLGVLTTTKGTPVYLKDLVVVIPAADVATAPPGSLDQWGAPARAGYTPERTLGGTSAGKLIAHSPVYKDPVGTQDFVMAIYVWMEDDVLEEDYLVINLAGFDPELDYFHAQYTVEGDSEPRYWTYESGKGTYPVLDALITAPPGSVGTFFPFAYFRFNGVSEIEDTGTDSYITTKRMLKYLGMDFDALSESINENPDIDDVKQAMMIMAVPANTEDPMEQRYLFDFFDAQFNATEGKFLSPLQSEIIAKMRKDKDVAKNTVIIQDARFKMALSNSGIFKRRMSGIVGNGSIGSHESGMTAGNTKVSYYDPITETTSEVSYPIQYHYYRRQISDTMFDEIQVLHLKMKYHISNKYSTTGDDLDDILLIPIDRAITQDYSIPDREILYARSLHYVFNSVVVTKVKWYQRGIFKIVMIVVALVITVLTYGAAWQAMAAAIAAGTITMTALVTSILIGVLEYLLFMAAVKLFVKIAGVEIALLVAVVAALAGGYMVIDAGGLAGAPWATELLSLSNGLTDQIGQAIQDNMQDLLGEYSQFIEFAQQQDKLLQTAQDLLGESNALAPFIVFGESPNDFYNRTVHSGNIGIMGIQAISSYVDVALTLPKLDATIGENQYAQ